jgi:arginine N-succinyltransferase
MIRYEIRGATLEDSEQLLRLARFLDTVNLPNEAGHVERLLRQSEQSFSGQIKDPRHRKYVFILWDVERRVAVGTSMVVAQLGRRDAPYIYLDVIPEEKYSSALDRHFHHTTLRIGFSYNGPTEIGGLVVDPDYRHATEHLGLFISYVRFLFIAAHPELFQKEILAELLPPLEQDGTSHLWEAVGRRFTGLTYAEADRLSSENKAFIRDLFPSSHIYVSLLSAEAQAVVGKVGAQTRGVEKMLRRIGFRYAERVDPFDGGPHFVANVDEISLVQNTRSARWSGVLEPGDASAAGLVARERPHAPWLQALATSLAFDEAGGVRVSAEAVRQLQLEAGDALYALSLKV